MAIHDVAEQHHVVMHHDANQTHQKFFEVAGSYLDFSSYSVESLFKAWASIKAGQDSVAGFLKTEF